MPSLLPLPVTLLSWWPSAHLVEDEVRALQGLDLLLAARHCLRVVGAGVDAGRLQLRELRLGLISHLGVVCQVLPALLKNARGLLLLAGLRIDQALLLRDGRLSLLLIGGKGVLRLLLLIGHRGDSAVKVGLDHRQHAHDARGCILVAAALLAETSVR